MNLVQENLLQRNLIIAWSHHPFRNKKYGGTWLAEYDMNEFESSWGSVFQEYYTRYEIWCLIRLNRSMADSKTQNIYFELVYSAKHFVRSVQIRSYFWSYFPEFGLNTGKYVLGQK